MGYFLPVIICKVKIYLKNVKRIKSKAKVKLHDLRHHSGPQYKQ